MAYYAHTHKADKIANKELFRLNRISFEEMLENLTILLDDDGCGGTATTANLPTNADVMRAIKNQSPSTINESSTAKVNDMYVVVWQEDNDYQWYLGYVKKIDDGKLSVDHLARKLKESDSKWKYPSQEDIHLADPAQIVKCNIEGEWDLTADSRKRLFTVTNLKTITCAFRQHID